MERAPQHTDHAAEAIEAIDRVLAAPPVSLDHALQQAVAHGRMTQTEATDCFDAYMAKCVAEGGVL